ncbi:hypothetical protein A4H97_03790 [Niastella yeongjuensis]|uniref:2TM domain-containing protein n=1 Tax=Niastella yeongjuensis TaxID=354355 RepID=A0A1V9EYB0_9BACT|nr:2TM domain-containing protein [Niastella yeongjuensis]OQP50955.1 hypothetical protein A4H97_03790 [Niastella yeongjuensis]SEN09745.1 2TM domain-containing protein [Niastella yeongjuensis]
MENTKDPQLWEIAQRRAKFKYNLIAYIGMNCFFWGIWLFVGLNRGHMGYPWPVWSTAGWGIGLLYHFFKAYVFTDKDSSVEREYAKLQQQENR